MRSLEVTATWHEEEEDVEVDDIEIRKHRDDLTESSSDEATGRKIARRKNGGKENQKMLTNKIGFPVTRKVISVCKFAMQFSP